MSYVCGDQHSSCTRSYNSIESLVLVIFSPRTIISDVSIKYSTMSTINNLNDNINVLMVIWHGVIADPFIIEIFFAASHSAFATFGNMENELLVSVLVFADFLQPS